MGACIVQHCRPSVSSQTPHHMLRLLGLAKPPLSHRLNPSSATPRPRRTSPLLQISSPYLIQSNHVAVSTPQTEVDLPACISPHLSIHKDGKTADYGFLRLFDTRRPPVFFLLSTLRDPLGAGGSLRKLYSLAVYAPQGGRYPGR